MAKSSKEARDLLLSLMPSVAGLTQVTAAELQCCLGIFRGETGYGEGWKPESEMASSHNWGAHQCPNTGKDCSKERQKGLDCALYTDTKDGTEKTRFNQCFRVFATDRDGAADGLKLLYGRKSLPPAMRTGDALLVSQVMRDTHYYGELVPVRYYAFMIFSNARAAAAQLGAPLAVSLPACSVCEAGAGRMCVAGCPGPGPVIVRGGSAVSGGSSGSGSGSIVLPVAFGLSLWALREAA